MGKLEGQIVNRHDGMTEGLCKRLAWTNLPWAFSREGEKASL